MLDLRRREFTTLLGGAAVAWPLAARAQQAGRMRWVGALLGWSEDVPEYRTWFAAFVQGLAQLGWVDGRNLRIDVRWTNANVDRARAFAKELVPPMLPEMFLPFLVGYGLAVRQCRAELMATQSWLQDEVAELRKELAAARAELHRLRAKTQRDPDASLN